MKTVLRLVVCAVMAASAYPVFAQSNNCGDGEANVPFETCKEMPVEAKKAPGAEELGGGSGEPGRAAAQEKAAKEEAAIREYAEREFLKHVWEDP
jgi:hypothetical protein